MILFDAGIWLRKILLLHENVIYIYRKSILGCTDTDEHVL